MPGRRVVLRGTGWPLRVKVPSVAVPLEEPSGAVVAQHSPFWQGGHAYV